MLIDVNMKQLSLDEFINKNKEYIDYFYSYGEKVENDHQILIRSRKNKSFEGSLYHLLDSSREIRIPYMEDCYEKEIYTSIYTNKLLILKGIVAEYKKGNVVLYSYTPFDQKRKIISILVLNDGIYHTVMIDNPEVESNDEINKLEVSFRDHKLDLDDIDRISITTCSNTFNRRQYEWETLTDALEYFNTAIYKTMDPKYIKKVLELNKELSHGEIK